MADANETDAAKRLYEIAMRIGVAMMTTVEADGTLHSRPMHTGKVDADGAIWLFTPLDSAKTRELATARRVGLAWSDIGRQLFASVSGRGEVVADRGKVKELWSEGMRTWFPAGPDDPNIGLIRVVPERGEFWDGPSGMVANLYGYAKAVATGRPPTELTRDEKVDLR